MIEKAIVQEDSQEARVQFLVDPISLAYLIGAEVDYKSDLEGECFIIRNPNAKTTCGCGSSLIQFKFLSKMPQGLNCLRVSSQGRKSML